MSGIPVYTMSPINPSKASGVTPQTSNISSNPGGLATTTASTTALSPTLYTPAQPGAIPSPQPTASTQRHSLLQPTPTTKSDDYGPSLPQPGAFPMPINTKIPPPKGDKNFRPQACPPQMSIPPPNSPIRAQPPAAFTSTPTAASNIGVVVGSNYEAQRQSLEHPPGYQQDAYASELTSGQQHAQDANNTGLDGTSQSSADVDGGDIWKTAKQWVSTAGNKIAKTEAEIWRKFT